jgi:TonB family protein
MKKSRKRICFSFKKNAVMKIVLLLFFLLICPSFLFAKIISGKIYLNKKEEECQKLFAMFYVEYEYDTKTKIGKAEQHYSDNELYATYEFSDNDPLIKNGKAYFYSSETIGKMHTYENNKKNGKSEYYKTNTNQEIEIVSYFKNNLQNGSSYVISNSKFIDSTFWVDGKEMFHQLDSNILVYFINTISKDSLIADFYKENSLFYAKHYFLKPIKNGTENVFHYSNYYKPNKELKERYIWDSSGTTKIVFDGGEEKRSFIKNDTNNKEACFVGGTDSLIVFLTANLNYPNKCRKKNIEQEVILQFTINENGELESPKIVSYTHSLLNKEAMRVIDKMPNWKPGIYKSKPTPCLFSLPISFLLDE